MRRCCTPSPSHSSQARFGQITDGQSSRSFVGDRSQNIYRYDVTHDAGEAVLKYTYDTEHGSLVPGPGLYYTGAVLL